MVVGVPVPPTVVAAVTAAEVAVAVAAKIGPKVVVTTFVAVFKVGAELVPGVMAAACEPAPGAVAPPGCVACVGDIPASELIEVPGVGTLGLVVGVDVVVV